MKILSIPTKILLTALILTFAACARDGGGAGGNIFEKMSIFSFITLTVFALVLIAFGGGRSRRVSPSSETGLGVRIGPVHPLAAAELTGHPIYVRESRTSFRKIVFAPDGTYLESLSVTTNGVKPVATSAGTWELTSDGKVRITPASPGTTRTYARISEHCYGAAALMKPDSGPVQAWYCGPQALTNVQISIFGFSASEPRTEKFTASLVSGLTVYWTTYPCLSVTDDGEIRVNPEAASGMIAFHDDGTLAKSIDNRLVSTPDYTLSIPGTWEVDNFTGALTITVHGYSTLVTILTRDPERKSLLVSTPVGNRRWYCDPATATADLAAFLSLFEPAGGSQQAALGMRSPLQPPENTTD